MTRLQKSNLESMGNHGKNMETMGKTWKNMEKYRKHMGKIWKNPRKLHKNLHESLLSICKNNSCAEMLSAVRPRATTFPLDGVAYGDKK